MKDLWICHYHVNEDQIAYICDYRDREVPEIQLFFVGGNSVKFAGDQIEEAAEKLKLPETPVEPKPEPKAEKPESKAHAAHAAAHPVKVGG